MSVDVFLWGPILKILLAALSVVFPRAHSGPRGSTLFWLRLVFYIVGVDHGPSASHHGQLVNTTRPRRVYHADANYAHTLRLQAYSHPRTLRLSLIEKNASVMAAERGEVGDANTMRLGDFDKPATVSACPINWCLLRLCLPSGRGIKGVEGHP